MRYAIIENGMVANVVEADEDFDFGDIHAVPTDTAGPGWVFHPGINTFSPPQIVIPVPQQVTRRQAKLAMLGAGILSQVEAAVSQADAASQIEWAEAQAFERNHPLIASLASQLGLPEEQVDDLFRKAATL